MRYLSAKKISILSIILITFILASVSTYADNDTVEFRLTADGCGGTTVLATKGEGTLQASADGKNEEKIRWDTDPSQLFPRMQGKKLATGWAQGGYWLVSISGKNRQNFKLSAEMYSSGKGPGEFSLLYSTDGTNYTQIPDSAVELTKTPSVAYNAFALPSELDNSDKIFLKIAISSDTSVSGKNITGVKDGSTYINNIVLAYDTDSKNTPTNVNTDPVRTYYEEGIDHYWENRGKFTGKYKFSVSINNDNLNNIG